MRTIRECVPNHLAHRDNLRPGRQGSPKPNIR
nr:MAG TPA: hypothetical protein [Caudoviricetes sp.]